MTAGFNCDRNKTELTISFQGAWNEKGRDLLAAGGENAWNSWELISFDQREDGSYKSIEKPIERTCLMAGKSYQLMISPLMAPAFHPEGECASRMGAKVTVKFNGKIWYRLVWMPARKEDS